MDQNTQPTPQTSPPSVHPVPPPPPKKKSGILIGILLLFLGILVGLTLAKTTLLSNLRIPYLGVAPTPTPIPIPTPTPDPTADSSRAVPRDWKTYTNNTFKFQFKYPIELMYLYDQLKQAGDNLLLQNFDGSTPRKETSSDFQMVLVVSDDTGLALEKVIDSSENRVMSTLTIDGEKAIKGTSIQKYEEVPTVWVKHGGYLFTMQLSTAKSTHSSLFDQILSTFKFTDANAQKVDTCLEQIYHLGSNAPGMTGMANPASVFCACMGGELETRENDQGQYGVCKIDGKEYDEWEYVRKFLPPDNPFIPLSSPTPAGGAI